MTRSSIGAAQGPAVVLISEFGYWKIEHSAVILQTDVSLERLVLG